MAKSKVLLILPSWPSPAKPYAGIFFQDYIPLLNELDYDVFIVIINFVGFRHLLNSGSSPLKFTTGLFSGSRFLSLRLPNLLPSSSLFIHICLIFLSHLFRIYTYFAGPFAFVFSHYSIFPGLLGYIISSSMHLPHIIMEHRRTDPSAIPPWESAFVTRACCHANYLVSPSHHFSKLLSKFYPSQTNIKTLPNILSQSFIAQSSSTLVDAFSTRLKLIQANQLNLLFVGNFIDLKRPFLFLEVIQEFQIRYPHIKLHAYLVGTGPLLQPLKTTVHTLDLGGNVSFRFYTPDQVDELISLYMDSHFLLSLSTRETFGLSILQSLSLLVPVIISDSGGPSSFFKPQYGCLLESLNPTDIASCIFNASKTYDSYLNALLHFPKHLFSRDCLRTQWQSLFSSLS